MGANAQTTVQKFLSGAVLTAEQQNFSAATGVPVFATTVTRDAAFGGSNKVLAEGQTCYLESTNVVQYYDGAAWATVGPTAASGLVLITAQTIGSAVSSVPVNDVFSSTYDNYKIIVSGGVGSVANTILNLTLGATVAGYKYGYATFTNASVSGVGSTSASSFAGIGEFNTNLLMFNIDVINPNLAKHTFVMGGVAYNVTNNNGRAAYTGVLTDTTQYTAFTITPASGTLTGGTVRVYGYQNS